MTRYFGVPLRNATSLGLGGTLALSTGAGSVPESLFAAGEQGAWYDPSDNSTMFQDAAGTTAVTAVEQAVGLILDKRFALGIGTEIVSNNTFATDTIWAKGTGWSIGSGVATKVAGSASGLSQAIALEANVQYRLVYTITRSAGSITPQLTGNGTVSGTARSAAGTYVDFLTAVSGNTTLNFSADATFAGTVDNVYLKRVSGNDAYQVTSASRPTLRARYNLLTYSEQFNNVNWAKNNSTISADATTAPDGTTTADLVYPTTTGTFRGVGQGASPTTTLASVFPKAFSFYVKAAGFSWVYIYESSTGSKRAFFNVTTGATGTVAAGLTATMTDVGNGWYRCVVTTSDAYTNSGIAIALANSDNTTTATASGTNGVYVWGAQAVRTDVFPLNTYQRIAASTDYVTGPSFPQYLSFDGTDDSLLTQSADFSGTDAVTVFSGLAKLSDAAQGVVVELSATIASNDGTFLLAAPDAATATYGWDSKGTAQVDAVATSVAAPRLGIVTGTADISADTCEVRVNGASADTDTGDQGSGNYGSFPLYIGRRNNASAPFNGWIYSLIVRGAQSSALQITQTEQWVNGKMNNMVTLP